MKLINQHQNLWQLKHWLTVVIGAANMLYMSAAFTETLKDPTQPPVTLNNLTAADNAISVGPVLQSVMIGPQTQAAIINGEKVLIGKKYQSATLIKVSEDKVILRNPDMTTQTLLMDYAIERKMVSPEAHLPTSKINAKHSAKPITKPIEVREK